MLAYWTPPALNDLQDISSYIEQDRSIEAADEVCQNIYESIQMLKQHPYLGRPGKFAGTREMVVGKYIVGYRIRSERIELIRIRHGARRELAY